MFGQTQLIHRPHLRVDDAEDEIETETLPHHAGAITTARIRIGKIRIAALRQVLALNLREETIAQCCRLFRRQPRHVRPDRLEKSMQTPDRRRVHAQMNIGGAGVLAEGQIFIHVRQHGSRR